MGFELEYVRTDRNGTKIYHDWTCPRCGGAGQSDNWIRTGRICYECGGTGKRHTPKIIKVYTDEYEAKLAAKREAKEKAKPQASQEELLERAAQARRTHWASMGFNAEGFSFIHTGNTYGIRDELKAAGGKWMNGIKGWAVPVAIERAGVKISKVNAEDVSSTYGYIQEVDIYDLLCKLS